MILHRHASEFVYQLDHAHEHDRLARALATVEIVQTLYRGRSRYEVMRHWARLRDAGHDAAKFMAESSERFEAVSASPQSTCRAVGTMADLLEHLGLWEGAVSLRERQREVAVRESLTREEAEAERSLGWLLGRRGRYDEALDRLERARLLYEEDDDRHNAALAVGDIGYLHCNRGEYGRALECYRAKLDDSEKSGDRLNAAIAILNIGLVHWYRGEHEQAVTCYRQSLAICEVLGDRLGAAAAIGNIAIAHQKLAEFDQATEQYERWLSICEELGDRHGAAMAVGNMGTMFLARREYDRAIPCFETLRATCEELDDRLGVSLAIGNMAMAHAGRHEYESALERFATALHGHREIGYRSGIAGWLQGRTDLLLDLLDTVGTVEPYPDYLMRFVPLSDRQQWRIAVLHQARRDADECLSIGEEIGSPGTMYSSTLLLARIAIAEGDEAGGVRRLREMVAASVNDEQRAELHYLLWKNRLDTPEEHGAESLRLLHELNKLSPKPEFIERIAELTDIEAHS